MNNGHRLAPRQANLPTNIHTPTFNYQNQNYNNNHNQPKGNGSPTRINFIKNVELTQSLVEPQTIPKPQTQIIK